jgi:hypothetical protein
MRCVLGEFLTTSSLIPALTLDPLLLRHQFPYSRMTHPIHLHRELSYKNTDSILGSFAASFRATSDLRAEELFTRIRVAVRLKHEASPFFRNGETHGTVYDNLRGTLSSTR